MGNGNNDDGDGSNVKKENPNPENPYKKVKQNENTEEDVVEPLLF